jgi:hypothetical protein
MIAYFYFTAPRSSPSRGKMEKKGVMKRSENMAVPVLPELDFMTPATPDPDAKPQGAQVGCLQEQFTGLVPARRERPMAEILAERMAGANPASLGPLFIP